MPCLIRRRLFMAIEQASNRFFRMVSNPHMITVKQPASGPGAGKIDHVVIIVKENHGFDNYFGTFPGANGMTMPRSPNPPPRDPDHRHGAWLTRQTTSVRQQFVEADIPAYFSYARQFTICDQYFTEVAGPSTPNHLMLIAADSPFIDNPKPRDTPRVSPSLPQSLEARNLTWGNYGGYAFQYLGGIGGKNKFTSDQFAKDASAGKLPNVSWVLAPGQFDEHPPDPGRGPMGNVTTGMQWTIDQVNAVVKGGLWSRVASSLLGTVGEDGMTMWTRRTSKLGSFRHRSHPTREHSSVTARGWAVLCSARWRDPATSRRSFTRT